MPPKKKFQLAGGSDEDKMTRIAIINSSKCKPKKCNQECKKSCPVVKLGKLCIEVGPKSKLAFISEPLCIGKLFNTVPLHLFVLLASDLLSPSPLRLWYLREKVPL
jgi:hypothetical protein